MIFIGKEDRVREKHKAELAKIGNQLRAEMANKGKAMKGEHTNRLAELKRTFSEAELLVNEREVIKKEAEAAESDALEIYRVAEEVEKNEKAEKDAQLNAREAETLFKKYDSNSDGIIDISEMQTRILFDKNRDGQVEEEEARYFLNGLTTVDLDHFKTRAWPRIKPFLMLESGLFKPPLMGKEREYNLRGEYDTKEGEEPIHEEVIDHHTLPSPNKDFVLDEELIGGEDNNPYEELTHGEDEEEEHDLDDLTGEEVVEYEDETGEGEVYNPIQLKSIFNQFYFILKIVFLFIRLKKLRLSQHPPLNMMLIPN